LRILKYLCKDCIETDLKADSKDEVLRLLAEKSEQVCPGLDGGALLSVLKEREALGSTGIGGGIAIPHGKIAGLEKLSLLLFRSLQGVPFNALDGKPVRIIVLLVAPEDAPALYLRVLARISKLLKETNVIEALLSAEDREAMRDILAKADSGTI